MEQAASTAGAILAGVRVIELADWVAGPFATSVLGDFGAEVIRVDLPGKVVNTRTLHGLEEADAERSPFFAIFAHNKKSVEIDIRIPAGREIFLDLIRHSDVLVSGFRPGVLEKWGLGWEILHTENPGLVMLQISGYGQTGPWKNRPGLDRVAQAFGGVTFLTGQTGGPPVRCGVGIADYSTGLWGLIGVMLGLYERRCNGGEGQMVDQALYESVLPMLCEVPMFYQRHGEIGTRTGNRVGGVSPGDAFQTADEKWVQISASGDVAWERLAQAMQRSDLLADPRYATTQSRDEHNDVLLPIVAEWVATMTADTVVDRLDEAGVAGALIQSIDELMSHPHVLARENFVQLDDPVFGPLPAYAPMPRMSGKPGRITSPGPGLGQHNSEIFGKLLGLDESTLNALADDGVIGRTD
jgi:crotonobetainyl-CoA:carnitine CoA-transferase CaiB-like acyl-CoA transferase